MFYVVCDSEYGSYHLITRSLFYLQKEGTCTYTTRPLNKRTRTSYNFVYMNQILGVLSADH